jgi:hypothetical protein
MNKHRLNINKIKNNRNRIIITNDVKITDENNEFNDVEIEKRTLIRLINETPDEIEKIISYIDSKVELYKKSATISNDNLYYYGMVGALLDIKHIIFKYFKNKKGV